MSEIAMNVAHMIDMLPDPDKNLAYELIKKLVLAWDPDFTKLTTCLLYTSPKAKDSGFVDAEEIDWSKIGHE